MASRTKPLISAAALASAAAIAVATPALSPNLSVPSPAALSKAAFQLTTLSDVLSVPPVVWTDILFGNESWGGILGPDSYGPEWAAPQDAFLQPSYVNPWVTFCDNGSGGKCQESGIPGVSYLFLDALINGNGNGFEDSDNWDVGFVNYLAEPGSFAIVGGGSSAEIIYENYGYSAATWYVLQGTLGQAVPELQVPIASLFWGPLNLSVFYNLGGVALAGLLNAVPVVGPITGNSLLAYLGDLPLDPENPSLGYYQYGLSGVLNYWVDIIDGSVPFPGAAQAVAAPEAAALVAAPADIEADTAKVASAAVAESAPVVDAPANDPVVDAPASDAPASVPVVEPPVADAPVVEAEPSAPAVEVAEDVATVEIGEVAPEVETKPAVAPEAPAVTEDDLDSDVADLDEADLDAAGVDAADSAPADAPKGSDGDVADRDSKPAADSAKADTDSAGAGDSSGAGDSAGSDKSDSDS
jgi:hypothetical protein